MLDVNCFSDFNHHPDEIRRPLHKERQENYFDPQVSSTILQRTGDREGSSLQDREQGEVGREHYNSAVHHSAHYGQRQ